MCKETLRSLIRSAVHRLGAVRLELEVALARGVGRLSRLAGAGGGTTLPGKLLASIDRDAVDALAAKLERGSALVSATNGKTTTCALAASVLAPHAQLARNAAGANLMSGVASTLVATRGADLGLFEVDEAALPEVARRVRPRVVSLGNLFRDQLDRYGELEIVAERWRAMIPELPADAVLAVNADDPLVGEPGGRARAGRHVRRRRSRPGAARPPARRRLEVLRALRDSVRLHGGVRRSSRRLPLPGVRALAAGAGRRRAPDRAARDRRCRLRPRDARGHTARRAGTPGALQRLQRARRGDPDPGARRRASTRSPPVSDARCLRSAVSNGSTSAGAPCSCS